MISFLPANHGSGKWHQVLFDEEGMEKMVLVLSRALNTYHDPELIKLLDELRRVYENTLCR